ncbi:MAG: hypothetical protein R3E79_05905 [Caldilineaceae bacterium]
MIAMLVAVQGCWAVFMARNEVQVYREPCDVVDEWIQLHQNEEHFAAFHREPKAYSGKFMLRLLP